LDLPYKHFKEALRRMPHLFRFLFELHLRKRPSSKQFLVFLLADEGYFLVKTPQNSQLCKVEVQKFLME